MTNRIAIRPLAIITVTVLTAMSLACVLTTVAPQPGPETIITQAFAAYQKGNSNTINDLMSEQGKTNAATFCGGAVINCLKSNYSGMGELKTSFTKVVSQTETAAEIELRTTWASVASELCQHYQLDKTDKGWRITLFDVPGPCQ